MTTTRDERRRKQMLDKTPLARFGRPDEVSVFLLSDLSHYVPGQVLSVDGGLAL